ncbi:regulatory protein RecX [Erythrobacter sp. HKB08]|uniref:regulatory protein RecX n=1 Tax=Erythrobacter sp. HKB08 TaxID=2502843 RepID=UPI0035192B62
MRKLHERGWEDEGEPGVPALVERYVELGYVDDEQFARSKAGSLLRRGYGARRIGESLREAGIGEAIREQMQPDEAQRREAVVALVRRRRFGPFYREELAPDRREKQLAAIVRAGHSFDHARFAVDAGSEQVLEEWLEEAREELE